MNKMDDFIIDDTLLKQIDEELGNINDNDEVELDDYKILENALNNDKEKIDEDMTCLVCGSKNIVTDTKNACLVCSECGIIIAYHNDKQNEKYAASNDASGCISTTNGINTGTCHTSIRGSSAYKLKIMQLWNQNTYKERSINATLSQMEEKCKEHGIKKSIIDNAKILYKNIMESKNKSGKNKDKFLIIRGINRESLKIACIFIGSKMANSPIYPKELAKMFDIDLTFITKGCKKFFEYIKNVNINYTIASSQASDFIKKHFISLKLSQEHIDTTFKMINNITKLDIASDHQSVSIAAACVLLLSSMYNLNIQKKVISDVFMISDVTITKTFKKILLYKSIITNDELTDQVFQKLSEGDGDFVNNLINVAVKPEKNKKGRPKKIKTPL